MSVACRDRKRSISSIICVGLLLILCHVISEENASLGELTSYIYVCGTDVLKVSVHLMVQ